MYTYKRKINYHETDMMQVVHHSNYIKYLEEARIDYLIDLGFPYEKIEAQGIYSPVVEVNCKYFKPVTFGDEITIEISLDKLIGTKFVVNYVIKSNDDLIVNAQTTHGFINKDGKVISIKREFPELFDALKNKMN